jgi:transposase-like protein
MAKRRSMREMRSLVARYESSGLTRHEVASQAGIAVQALDYWRRKARTEGNDGGGFVEIRPAAGEAPSAEVTYPNGTSVRFFGAVDPILLLALLSAGRRAA